MLEKNKKIKKVLFYTHTPRAFRSTLIGHLYEISQVYPTILLSEKLDSETEEALRNKELFPKLEKIIPVSQFTGPKMNLLAKNRYLCELAENITQNYKPDIVISASDTHSFFELYLMRFAKRIKAINIAIQPTMTAGKKSTLRVDLNNAYLRFPSFLPLWFRLYLVKIRKYFGHFIYYWILPLMVGEKPFFGKSSHILRKGNSGMRDSDYQIVFSKRDCDIYLKDGVPAEKLYILSHPLFRKTREFFEMAYLNRFKKIKKTEKIATLMLPEEEPGFRRKDYSLILKKERERNWIETVKLISQTLLGWEIYVKPHPDIKNFSKIKKDLESLFANIEVLNPQESADKYIEIAEVIIGLPLSASTTLFTASLQSPGKPIISLDFHQELLGDVYKDFEGIEYIDTKEKFINILETIRDNEYQKRYQKHPEELRPREFPNTVEILKYLLQKKENEIY